MTTSTQPFSESAKSSSISASTSRSGGVGGLAYAATCYAVFQAGFAYFVGFLNNVAVPKGIDDGPQLGAGAAVAVNVGLVLLWGVQHSLMARGWFKRWWTRVIPAHTERATYVLASVLALGIVMAGWAPIEGTLWQVESFAGKLAIWALAACGWTLLLVSSFEIDHFALFGLKQPWLAYKGRTAAQPKFQTRWIYRVVRHPVQTGVLVGMWATPSMTWGHLLFASLMTVYVLIGLHFEERALIRELGDEYRSYMKRVARLVPFVRFL